MKKEYIWVVSGNSESGDETGPFAFKHKPTDDELKKIITDTGEKLDDGGDGNYDSYVDLDISRIPLIA